MSDDFKSKIARYDEAMKRHERDTRIILRAMASDPPDLETLAGYAAISFDGACMMAPGILRCGCIYCKTRQFLAAQNRPATG